ncbi:glycosyltransferase family protein [Hippea jasoniae]|uniref:hypothetical protein n=1 Tax=Hippea jasoniae TaxID=944479 RepID=UPI000558395F|nr:hypothetical protein [Hippea jasoniae]
MKKSELIKSLKENSIELSQSDKEYLLENLDLSKADDLIIYYLITKNKELFRQKYFEMDNAEIVTNRQLFKVLFETNSEYIDVLGKFFYGNTYKNATTYKKKEFLIKFFHVRLEYIDKEFAMFYPILKKLLYSEIKSKNDEMVFFLYAPLTISFIHENKTSNERKRFNREIDSKISKFIKNTMIKKYNIKPVQDGYSNKKKKVGFLIDRAVLHSPNNVAKELFKVLGSLKDENYEFYILNIEFCDLGPGLKKDEDILKSTGLKYINFHKELNCINSAYYNQVQKALKIRDFIINEKFDILIANGILHPTVHFLFITRTAPRQIYWSHGNCAIDFEGIDERISHFSQECKDYEWKIFSIPFSKEELVGSEEEKKEGLKLKKQLLEKYGQDTVILGTIGRLVKIDNDEYIKTVAEIMKENSNTIYLACGSGNNEGIKEKIKKYGIPEDRFIFTGFINKHVYGWVIDVYLAPFYFAAGQALQEFLAKGGLAVQLERK